MENSNSLVFENIFCLPSFHNKLQFVLETRRLFAEIQPEVIAVELPDIYYSEVLQAVSLLPRITLLCLNQGENDLAYIPIFPNDSMIEGIRLARENKLPIVFIDVAKKNYQVTDNFAPPDDYALNYLSLEKFYQLNKPYFSSNEADQIRESSMAFHLNHLSQKYKKVLFIGGMAHWEGIRKNLENKTFKYHSHELEELKSPFLARPGERALISLLEEIPYLVFHYELARMFNLSFAKWPTIIQLIQEAKNLPLLAEENFTTREVDNLLSYARKLAAIDQKILPDLYNLLLAAKQTLGDDYGIELLELAQKYPFRAEKDLPVLDLNKNTYLLEGKNITLKRMLPDYQLQNEANLPWEELKLVRKKKDDLPDDYVSEWFSFGFYSHLPEDKLLEGFIDRLENKLVSEQTSEPKIREFSGSLLDGLALRETIREIKNHKIYVKEFHKEKIRIGAWLLIFSEELSLSQYPWSMALSAEHHNESDIAFYASNPLLHPVSRQIIRADYGALLAFKPPLPDQQKVLWTDLDVPEEFRLYQLFNLALEFSLEKGILYVGNKPPEAYFYKLAEQKNKHLFYLPLSRLSNRNLRKIKRFHLLKSRKTRKIADDYL